MNRFVKNEFSLQRVTVGAIGIEFATKDVKIGDKTVTFQVWDTAGWDDNERNH